MEAFTHEQVAALKAPLSRAHVKSRSQAGRSLSYVEGWKAIAEANRIFGFDGWDRETLELRECGPPRQMGDKWRVAFMCRVRIRVRPRNQLDLAWAIIRDGTGYGSGIDKDLGQAYESAVKEAETDAMKRGLMTFGNPFGLALYDKDQANVTDDPPVDDSPVYDPSEVAAEYIAECNKRIDEFGDLASLTGWWRSDARKQAFRDFQLTDDEGRALQQRVTARAEELKPRAVS